MTPFLYAASVDFGDAAMIELLVKAGADVNSAKANGTTALMLAAAINGKLKDPAVLEQQTRRMLLDPRSESPAPTATPPARAMTWSRDLARLI